MALKKKVSQIVKSAMYDDLREEYKKLLIDYDILKSKHLAFKQLFEEYRALQTKRAEELMKAVDNIKGSDQDVS